MNNEPLADLHKPRRVSHPETGEFLIHYRVHCPRCHKRLGDLLDALAAHWAPLPLWTQDHEGVWYAGKPPSEAMRFRARRLDGYVDGGTLSAQGVRVRCDRCTQVSRVASEMLGRVSEPSAN